MKILCWEKKVRGRNSPEGINYPYSFQCVAYTTTLSSLGAEREGRDDTAVIGRLTPKGKRVLGVGV